MKNGIKGKTKVVFVGSFLSGTKGTKGISEHLAQNLALDNIEFLLVSRVENRFIRFLHIVFVIVFSNYRKVHIDVFSGNSFLIAEISSFICSLRNKPLILTLHGGRLVEFSNDNKRRIKRLFDRAGIIQTPSRFLQEHFVSEGFNVEYLPNSILSNSFEFKREKIKPFSILWVRSFSKIYNPEVPIKVLIELLKVFPEATLTMVGPDQGLLNEVIEYSEITGVRDKVEFTGKVKNSDLHKFYQTHSVYLNTTSYESFGVALIEAASCGIPIVSNSVGEIPIIWEHGENILLVEDNDIKSYVERISELFSNVKLSNALSSAGKDNVKKFDWDCVKPQWIEILKD